MPTAFWSVAGAILVGLAIGYFALVCYEQWNTTRAVGRRDREVLQRMKAELAAVAGRSKADRKDGGWSGVRRFVVAQRVQESSDVCSFHLKPHDGKALPAFSPGQYLTFTLRIAGSDKPVIRCYSLSAAPGPDAYRVSIKRVPAPGGRSDVPAGLGSNHFHDAVREGDILDVKAPSGHFHLDETNSRPVCLLSAGIGLTPVLSMLLHLTRERSDREVWFIHGVRHARELIQAEALRRIARDHPNVRLKICVSDALPEEHAGRDFDHAGRVSVDLLKQLLPANNYVYYACGPGAFMESLTTGLATWGVPKADIRFETFGPSTVKRQASAAAVTLPAGTELTIAFGRAGKPISWDPNCATLLDLAERHGVPVASGCRAGNCGTCLTAIIEGEVDYVHPPGSPPAQGSCLVCIARPKTRLILDV